MENSKEINRLRIRLMKEHLPLLRAKPSYSKRMTVFLVLLFLPFSKKPSGISKEALELGLETFLRRYREKDPSKDVLYIKRVLPHLINDPHSYNGTSYVHALEEMVTDFIEGKITEAPFNDLIVKLIRDAYFFEERDSLLSWPRWVKRVQGEGHLKAVINAPMGLGKTYQIAKALARTDCSAVIFMPTIKTRDAIYKDLNLFVPGDTFRVVGRDPNCECFREYLELKSKGLKPGKKQLCEKCSAFKESQNQEIAKHRIIVTTHAQYSRFHFNYKWYGPTGKSKEDLRSRDFFVIDEDITMGYMLNTSDVTYGEFNKYKLWIQTYPRLLESNFKEELDKFKAILERSTEDSYILPTAKGFSFSHSDASRIGKWVRKGIEEKRIKNNPTNAIVKAFNHGCSSSVNNKQICFNPSIEFLMYDFDGSSLPIHVFFDATEVNDKCLNKVFPPFDKEIPRLKCEVRPLGTAKVYHVTKTDLPKTEFNFLSPKVGKYLKYLVWSKKGIAKIPKNNARKIGYFVATTESNDRPGRVKGYKDYVKGTFESMGIPVIDVKKGVPSDDEIKKNVSIQKSGNYAILAHYGNLRGINDAIGCSVGILLGAWQAPEYVEVAWAAPFLGVDFYQDRLKKMFPRAEKTGFIPISQMKKYSPAVNRRAYVKGLHLIQEVADSKRNAENEQALGRNRSIFRDVDFYIVTKDDIRKYAVLNGAIEKEDEIGNIIFQEGEYVNSEYIPVMLAMDEMNLTGEQKPHKDVRARANQILNEIGEKPLSQRTVDKHIQRYNGPNRYADDK